MFMASDALQKSALAAALEAYMASLVAPTVRLFKDAIVPTPTTNLAGLSQPTGSWYTEVALTYGQVFENPDGSMSVVAQSVQFNYSGTDPAETVYGWFVVDPGSPDIPISAGLLPAPVTLGTVLDSVIVQPAITLAPVPLSS